jgi:outer membrane biosynthesis protein TonB
MKSQHRIARILSTTLTASLLLAQSVLGQSSQPSNTQTAAQQNPDINLLEQTKLVATQPAQNPAPANAQPAQPAGQNQQTQQRQPGQPQQQTQPQQPVKPSGTTVNPSQAPLQPITTYPDASGAQQQPSTTAPAQANVPEGPRPKQQQQTEPVGAAAAERVPTAGGAAAKPAGVAIAPAKQHQTRSLLIKVGAALAAGAAVGTVFALSRGTSSTPPGAGSPGVTQK